MSDEAPKPKRRVLNPSAGPFCTGKSKRTGKPCGKFPIKGSTVCYKHGGNLPCVRKKAAERVAAAEAMREFGLGFAKDSDLVLAALGCIAGSNPGDLFDDKGKLIPVKDLPERVQAAIASIEAVTGNIDAGDGKKDKIARIKLWDKIKTLDILTKHHGLQTDKVQHEGELVFRWEK